MTISYRGPVSFNRWLFVDPTVSPETVYCLDYNPETRSFEAFTVSGPSLETTSPATFEGKSAAPHLRSLLPAKILADITLASIRRRA